MKTYGDYAPKDKDNKKPSILREWFVTLLTALFFATTFKSFAFAHFSIPSESMVPTLEVGDRLVVNKNAYGYSKYSLPFAEAFPSFPTKTGRIFYREPKRGDVIVFQNPVKDMVMIKRLIGLPGDKIQIVHGRLYINGSLVKRQNTQNFSFKEYEGEVVDVQEYNEHLPDGRTHKIIERTDGSSLDKTLFYDVPKGHLFFMGDNRDNSADSRMPRSMGFVPIENMIGRAEFISFSTYNCEKTEELHCGKRRFLERIQ